jgi:hypothetical protein
MGTVAEARTFDLFKPPDVDTAWEAWGANCGPATLAAIAGYSLKQLRPGLGDFERRRYMNPTHMLDACRCIRLPVARHGKQWPSANEIAAVFIQWGGPWLKPGVPIGAAYRNTHWIALAGEAAYDVNVGHWVHRVDWTDPVGGVAAEIMRRVPRCDGTWTVRTAIGFDWDAVKTFRLNCRLT